MATLGCWGGAHFQVCHRAHILCCVTSGQLGSVMSPAWPLWALHLRPPISSDENTGPEVTSPLLPSPSWPEQRALGARRDPVDSTGGSVATCMDPHNSKARGLGSPNHHLLNLYLFSQLWNGNNNSTYHHRVQQKKCVQNGAWHTVGAQFKAAVETIISRLQLQIPRHSEIQNLLHNSLGHKNLTWPELI